MALYFECRINKNPLLQTVFLAILPTGWWLLYDYKVQKSARLTDKIFLTAYVM